MLATVLALGVGIVSSVMGTSSTPNSSNGKHGLPAEIEVALD